MIGSHKLIIGEESIEVDIISFCVYGDDKSQGFVDLTTLNNHDYFRKLRNPIRKDNLTMRLSNKETKLIGLRLWNTIFSKKK